MSGRTPRQESAVEAPVQQTRTRFDLEQEILECWRVVDDIQLFASQGHQDWNTLSAYYQHKFDRLWETFEITIREGTLK